MRLKELYQDYFKIGVACEKINGRFTGHEIGNPAKEALMADQFNSMTCANELKPMYNMGFTSPSPFEPDKLPEKNPDATEEYLPMKLNPSGAAMLDWAKANGLKVRGHVLVWHSQCPKEIFCKGYEPVLLPVDPEALEKNPMLKFMQRLDPVCFVDRQTMLKRLESYIHSVMDTMYSKGYADTIYAWDVVNEAIELADKTPTGLRNSYWYQVIGDDFIYWAFKFAKAAVVESSKKYAAQYGVDPEDEEALKSIQPKLFYNDYNEFEPAKKLAIIAALERSTEEHGSIIGEGLIDGIGMQGHLSDNNDVEEYDAALRHYGSLVSEVHVTELDVKCTCTNANEEYYQAVFYKKLFECFVKAKKDGINLTSVTLWGLTDDNSWIRGANPLLFRGDLSPKKSYDALVYALTGEDLGEPQMILCDLSDRFYDFTPAEGEEQANLEALGIKMRGFGMMKLQSEVSHSGKWCILDERRAGDYSGISLEMSDFIGQTVAFSAWIKTPAAGIVLKADFGGQLVSVLSMKDCKDEWTEMKGEITIPTGLYACAVMFTVEEAAEGVISPLYVDDISVKLIGQKESFETDKHIASIRGAGHLPFITVTDSESRDGKSHSLMVTRQEKDATVKFNIASYIGCKVKVSAYVKTADKLVKMGLDGAPSVQWVQTEVIDNTWTLVEACAELDKELRTAEFYLETDGNAPIFVDDIFVTLA